MYDRKHNKHVKKVKKDNKIKRGVISIKKKKKMSSSDRKWARHGGRPTKINNKGIITKGTTNKAKLIDLQNRKPISIIIAAYKAQNFIEECLDSIQNQTYFQEFNNYEILVGVDGCEKTLNKLKEIKDKYKNLRIFMMTSNKGPYVTFNTLLNLSKYDNIIRFDSDDIMYPHMINEIMLYEPKYEVIRFKLKYMSSNISLFPKGVLFYKKYVFDNLIGFLPWRCSADTELLNRIEKNNYKILKLDKILFKYREHDNSLTKTIKIKDRLKYHKQMDKIKITERIINEYEEY